MMFNKTQMDAYNNIKAPEELYEKVVNSKPQKSKIYLIPLISSLAACLILVFGIAAFGGGSFNPDITFDGSKLTADTIVVSDGNFSNNIYMRSSASLKIPVEIKLSEKTKVSVSEGLIVLENGENAKDATLKGDVAFIWEVGYSADSPQSVMTLESFSGTCHIYLTQYSDGSFTATIN